MTRVVRSAVVGALIGLCSVGGCGVDETILRPFAASPPLTDDAGSNAPNGDAPNGDAPNGPDVFTPNTSNVFAVALGWDFSCALARGVAFCWGNNIDGALGTGQGQSGLSPKPVKGGRIFDSLSAGQSHACGLERETGSVFCWGYASHGQLGQGDKTTHFEPVVVPLPGAARAMSVGYSHSCAILKTGELYCWGVNEEGQLGQNDAMGTNAEITSPTRVGNAADWFAIAGGQGHTCGLRQSAGGGTLWCWGRNNDTQIGLGPGQPSQIRSPSQVGALDDWTSVDLGQNIACAIAAGGSLRCWGGGGDATLNGTPSALESPTTIGSDRDWSKVSIDAFHTCGISTGAQLRCWGRNLEGQLGLGDVASRTAPTPLPGAWSSVSVGRFHTCAVKTDNTISCTGDNETAQLGLLDTASRNVFTAVDVPAPRVE